MKIVAIGIGQCGCNIADEFWGINDYARSFFGRRIEILVDAFAINTDETDLASLRHIPRDKHHRIVIGLTRTFGHGVGKKNLEGARIMKDACTVIIDSVLSSSKFHESDAVVVIASGAGGTGSGGIGWLVKGLKERIEKPVYGMIVLPFGYEEKGETSYAVTNSAACVKTVSQYADAVFLLDNERFARADVGLATNLSQINKQMVKNFYDLFCAGEEQNRKYIGAKVIDAGDIRQTLSDICTIGRGEVPLSAFRPWRKGNYRQATKEGIGVAGAFDLALNNLSLRVSLAEATKILVLVSGPRDVITLPVLSEIVSSLQEKSPKAVVRIGDYPRRGKEVSVTLILSRLTSVPRVEELFTRAERLLVNQEETEKQIEQKIRLMHETSAKIPLLAK